MKIFSAIICFGLLASICVPSVSADSTEDVLRSLQAKVEQLEKRLQAQEERNAELEARLTGTTSPGQEAQSDAKIPEGKYPILSSNQAELYGYVKLDASYDSSDTDTGNFARWVLPNGDDDEQFNITANQSRLGLKLNGPEYGTAKSNAQIEVDFFEGGAENKARLMMRHAFLQMQWPDSDFSILAGQTTDVIQPLVPTTLNYPVAWWAGDIGYRRPQLRLTKGFDVSDSSKLTMQVAAARTIGDDTAFGNGDTGEDSGFPSLQGRVAYNFPVWGGRNASFGVSGHWGEEEYDHPGGSEDVDSWSTGIDVQLPIASWLAFSAEAWTGANLDAYLGGVAQGITVESVDGGVISRGVNVKNFQGALLSIDEIESTGGWAQLAFGPFDRWSFNLGGSIDDPKNSDLPNGARSRNGSVWGNVLYDWNKSVRLGMELSYWETEYENQDTEDSVRVQGSVIYKF